MAKNITLFPVLTKQRLKDIFTVPIPILKYTRGGVIHQLTIEDPYSPISSINDEKGYWNADEYDLYFEWNITYKNTSWLYDYNNWEYACA